MNLPNKLTVGRVIAVPFFIAAYMTEYYAARFCAVYFGFADRYVGRKNCKKI